MWGWQAKPTKSRKQMWADQDLLSLEERRARYHCSDYLLLDSIPSWDATLKALKIEESAVEADSIAHFPNSTEVNRLVSVWRGDITRLEIDAVVNAANESLLGGGGIDGAIHRAAGPDLRLENMQIPGGCKTGDCKISRGYCLPAKYILSTVGPVGERPKKLASAYRRVLEVALEHGVRSIAFCCISTGVFGYPNQNAAHIALKIVRDFLDDPANQERIDRIIFCVFMETDTHIYRKLMRQYFPDEGWEHVDPSKEWKARYWSGQSFKGEEMRPEEGIFSKWSAT